MNPLPHLASALARDGKTLEAWKYLERSLARGLLDDLSAREARKLTAEDRDRERKLVGEIEGIDARLFASKKTAATSAVARLDSLRTRRLELQSELSAFEKHLVDAYGVAEGKNYEIERIQAALPEDGALVGWLDISGHGQAAELRSGHWAIVVRSKGEPRWVSLSGSGDRGLWTEEEEGLGAKLASEVSDRRRLPRPVDRDLLARLCRQRLEAVEKLLREEEGSRVRRLIVLPSPALRDVPLGLLTEHYTVSYAPSGSVLAWLREKKNQSGREAPSLLALGDPYLGGDEKTESIGAGPLPEHGAYLSMVVKGSNGSRNRNPSR